MSAIHDLPAAERLAHDLAVDAHAAQRYGDAPYTEHLASVRQVLADFGAGGELGVAAWLHDAVEDTPITIEEIRAGFGERVAALVWAVTGVGPNRKARVADAYAKIRSFDGPGAAILKLADRIANTEASARDPQRLAMYRKEQEGFEATIGAVAAEHPAPVIGEMLKRLRQALA